MSVFLTRFWALNLNILLLVHDFSDSLFLLCKNWGKMGFWPSGYLRESLWEGKYTKKEQNCALRS